MLFQPEEIPLPKGDGRMPMWAIRGKALTLQRFDEHACIGTYRVQPGYAVTLFAWRMQGARRLWMRRRTGYPSRRREPACAAG
jgi:hypothetical protein